MSDRVISIDVQSETWPIKGEFRISRGSKREVCVVVVRVTVHRDGERFEGWGECVPYGRYGETVEGVMSALTSLGDTPIRASMASTPRASVPQEWSSSSSGNTPVWQLPDSLGGAARNAIDCALWDLHARIVGRPVHRLLGLDAPKSVPASHTLSLAAPGAMAAQAAELGDIPWLKLKVAGDEDDVARVRAVHEAAPHASLVVDANEAWTPTSYQHTVAKLETLGVKILEQPLPSGHDEALATLPRPIPVCADESFHGAADLDLIASRYDLVNIKLDKTGGLTRALEAKRAAEAMGLSVMVGCMASTSLSLAPAWLLSEGARFSDLDAGLLLERDRELGTARSADGLWIAPPAASLWGEGDAPGPPPMNAR